MKNIEQNSTWSGEDEERFQSCLNILQGKGFMGVGVIETINSKWLKSLKERMKEEGLTEFEKELNRIVIAFSDAHAYMDKNEIHHYSKGLLDLARKELQPEFDKEMDKMLAETDKVVYQKGHEDALKELDHCVIIPEDDYYEQLESQYHKGHEDALKSLPKWKKVDSNPPKVQYNLQGKRLYKDGEYYIELSDLEALPKEE